MSKKEPLRLVRIDTKTNEHVAYEGNKRIVAEKFTRLLDATEVEAFRKDAKSFLSGIEEVEEAVNQ